MKSFFTPVSLFQIYFRYSRIIGRRCTMSNSMVFVRQVDDEETMKIYFTYGNQEMSERNFTFSRSKDEKLENSLFRIKFKIQNMIVQSNSRKKRKQVLNESSVELPSLDVSIISNDEVVDIDVMNKDAWASGNRLKICDRVYEISKNPPSVTHISLPKNIMAGFPVYPKIKLEFCSKEDSTFTWFRLFTKADRKSMNVENLEIVNKKGENWLKLSDSFFYITTDNDVDRRLIVSCLPKLHDRIGKIEEAVSLNVVQPGPGNCPFEDRHAYTKKMTEAGSMRCVSYNILADLYADSDTARNELFPYCPPEALSLDYRKQLYLKEILGYNADLICLQEVDRKVFLDDLIPVLSSAGLQGVYNEKGGQVVEGLACFYRSSKFKVVDFHAVLLSEALKTKPVLQNVFSKISENEKLTERILQRTTTLQVVLLEVLDVPNKRILVGNTHLYFHPESDNIRLLQGTCFILYLENLLKQYKEQASSFETSLVLCGDFNSCPEFGVYKLMTTGFLPEDCEDWKSNPEEVVPGMPLSHTLSLDSACGIPRYTNFTVGFVGCLDYIFYDKNCMSVSEVVPLPTHKQITEKTALPNELFPSDHLAQVCTLKWK